jgi:hypothetical protein
MVLDGMLPAVIVTVCCWFAAWGLRPGRALVVMMIQQIKVDMDI